MPRRPRHTLRGVAFHVMNRAVRGTNLFETQGGFDAFSTLMHHFEGRHANNWAGAHNARGKGYVYQGRFKAIPIQTSHSLFRVCRYVERNALRQNLVRAAEDWEWGSLHARCNNYYPIPLARWPILPPANWVELVNTPQTEDELADLRVRINRDQPIGDPKWVEAVAPFVGLTLRPAGRPKKRSPAPSP